MKMRIMFGLNNLNYVYMMLMMMFMFVRRAATASRYALRLNNGFGMVCVMVKLVKNCFLVI